MHLLRTEIQKKYQSWERSILLKPETKAFYKSVVALTVPLALQNLINVGVSRWMSSCWAWSGETALSGASLAGQIQFIMTLLISG